MFKEVFENNKIDELSKDIILKQDQLLKVQKYYQTTKRTKRNESPSSKSNILIELKRNIKF